MSTYGIGWDDDFLKSYQKGKRDANKGVAERDHQKACLKYLSMHPKVAWVQRINSGVWKEEDRYISFGFVGCSDIIGQMKDGRFLAFECKRVGEKPSTAQQSFLDTVWANGGIVGWGQLKQAMDMLK